MLSLLERWITDARNMDYLLETIISTDYEEILVKNKISDFIKRRKIPQKTARAIWMEKN